MENLIGRKVRGFKFDDNRGKYPSWNEKMEKQIDEIGEIIGINQIGYRVQFADFSWTYPADQIKEHLVDEVPTHYDNTNGSIYKFCNDQKLNAWEFDIIKRIVRSRKKGMFKEDLEKTKVLIDLYLKEFDNE